MIRKTFLIAIIFLGYVFVVSSDNETKVLKQVKSMYEYCVSSFKNMEVEVHVKKLSLDAYPD